MAARPMQCQGGLRRGTVAVQSAPMAKVDEERAKRLADALRQNLRRRKAQARGEEREESSRRRPEPMNSEAET